MSATSTEIIVDLQKLKANIMALQKAAKNEVVVLCDENTFVHCWPAIAPFFASIDEGKIYVMPAGEEHKNLQTAIKIWQWMANQNLSRNAILFNVGGGVVTDMGGFAASTFKRGIRFVHLPTSLLAMVDAAMGGKTGVDLENAKNMVGTFAQPEAVLAYPNFLKSLPKSQFTSGFAEVIKHGLIAQPAYFHQAQSAFDKQDFAALIAPSVEVKMSIVNADEKEGGQRKLLNFGHTLGHAIESFFLQKNKPILHGEAVAAGMQMAAFLSAKKMGLPRKDLHEIDNVLSQYFLQLSWDEADEKDILNWAKRDKKNSEGQLKFVLLSAIGKAHFDVAISESEACEALQWYRQKVASK